MTFRTRTVIPGTSQLVAVLLLALPGRLGQSTPREWGFTFFSPTALDGLPAASPAGVQTSATLVSLIEEVLHKFLNDMEDTMHHQDPFSKAVLSCPIHSSAARSAECQWLATRSLNIAFRPRMEPDQGCNPSLRVDRA